MLDNFLSDRSGHSFHATYHSDETGGRHFGAPSALSEAFIDELLGRAVHQYEPELAYLLSVIAGWSYTDGPTLAKQLKFYGVPQPIVEEISVRNESMYIVSTAHLVRSKCGRVGFLSFRGTEPTNIINWLTDADVSTRNFAGRGKVHRGFYANLRSIWDDVSLALNKAIKAEADDGGHHGGNGHSAVQPLERLYVTGHSLGGAMAVLAAARILVDGNARLREVLSGVYTFGQPAVGDKRFAEQYRGQLGSLLHRHEFKWDVVPHLPPMTVDDFAHIGEVRVSPSENEGWELQEGKPQARYLVATVVSVLGSFVLRRMKFGRRQIPMFGKPQNRLFRSSILDDHSPARYIEASRAALSP